MQTQQQSRAANDEEPQRPPRSELIQGGLWAALGVCVLAGSLAMDRLERQNINPYTIPGLLPALLGIGMILLGAAMAFRSWRRGALTQAQPAATGHEREERRRIWVVIALCLTYAVVLVGHGMPFWLASWIFVSGSILILQRMSQNADDRLLTPRVWIKALVIGVCAAVITQLVFQELFLVRMP